MVRARPTGLVSQTFGPEFERFCSTAEVFWQRNVPAPSTDRVIVVELLMQEFRVAIRNLTLANALRRVTPARMLVVVGPDPAWKNEIWDFYDAALMTRVARAYGAEEVIDLSEVAASGDATLEVLGRTLTMPAQPATPEHKYTDLVEASAVRVLRIPEVTEEIRRSTEYAQVAHASRIYAGFWEALFTGLDVTAFVSSHIDYHQWGLAAESATRNGIPVMHVQSTGNLKAYALFPDSVEGDGSYRKQLTRMIGDHFENTVWPNRQALRRAAELTAWRAKVNLGRPSWWRGGGAVSQLEFNTPAERLAVRRQAMRRYGFDPSKPVIVVFNHAVSDAVKSNTEIFENLADWFTQTAEYAVHHSEVNWLFLDHPSQANYDGTEMFEALGERLAEHRHVLFRPSMALSKNAIWSLVDLVVTVRGSASNEYPAYGVAALQAGWSEWSHCGFTMRADDQEDYWRLLGESIEKLCAGEELITPEQVERARLWMWFYRCASDVLTPIVPHWETGTGDDLAKAVTLAMSYNESDGDAALVSGMRLWDQHAPFLLREDMAPSGVGLAAQYGIPQDLPNPGPLTENPHNTTVFDAPAPAASIPCTLSGGTAPAVVMLDGFARGTQVIGRCNALAAMIGLKVDASGEPLRVRIEFSVDDTTEQWWRDRTSEPASGILPTGGRAIRVSCQGVDQGVVYLAKPAEARSTAKGVIEFDVPPESLDPASLLVIGLDPVRSPSRQLLNDSVMGVRVESIELSVPERPLKAQLSGGDSRLPVVRSGLFTVVPPAAGAPPARWRFEQTAAFSANDHSATGTPVVRASKGGRRSLSGVWTLQRRESRSEPRGGGAPVVSAVDLTGRTVPVTLETEPGTGVVTVGLPEDSGPAMVSLVIQETGGLTTTPDWMVLE